MIVTQLEVDKASEMEWDRLFESRVPGDDAAINVFCATGEGGGVDPTCSPGGGGSRESGGVRSESTTPPPPGASYQPSTSADSNRDGVTDAARVGVPAASVPPPPPMIRLPNLTQREREVETSFMDGYEADPDGVASNYRDLALKMVKPGDPPTFATDDAKALSVAWSHPDPETRADNRSTLNLVLHSTANAIAKRSFVQHLDTLKEGDSLLVTVGGVGAGKGYALKNVPEALVLKSKAAAVWDSAGDQNATENTWVQKEAEARGLKVDYVYVHADPRNSWANPKMGVVKRAGDPADGRMVDARVFADSYDVGAKNMAAFHERHKDNPSASFTWIDNRGVPKKIDGLPGEALRHNSDDLHKFAVDAIHASDAPPRVKRGGTVGQRVWP